MKNLGKPPAFRQNSRMPEGKLARGGFRSVALFCASLAVLFALLTFIGWISGLQLLASVRARYIPMAPSTALCFSLLGIGIVLHLQRPGLRWVPRLLAAVVLIIAVAKLVEFLSDLHFGIDAWFVRNPEMFGEVPTGRMAPMTALDFVFTALGLIALTRPEVAKWAGALGALATIISAVVLVGYWYGTPLALRRHHHSGRAPDRLGIFSLRQRDCRRGRRGRVAVEKLSRRLHAGRAAPCLCPGHHRRSAHQWLGRYHTSETNAHEPGGDFRARRACFCGLDHRDRLAGLTCRRRTHRPGGSGAPSGASRAAWR